MSSARERTGRQQACEVDGCPGCEDCPGGRHYERMKGRGRHNHIRVRTVGLPMTVARMSASAGVPASWMPEWQPSIAHGFPGRYMHCVQPATTLGEFLVTMLAHLHVVQ